MLQLYVQFSLTRLSTKQVGYCITYTLFGEYWNGKEILRFSVDVNTCNKQTVDMNWYICHL